MASPEVPDLTTSPNSPNSPHLPPTPQLPRSVGFVNRDPDGDDETHEQAAVLLEQVAMDRVLGLDRALNTEDGGGELAYAFVPGPVRDLSDNGNTTAQAQAHTETQAQASVEDPTSHAPTLLDHPALFAAHNHSAQLRYPVLPTRTVSQPSIFDRFGDLVPTPPARTRLVRRAVNLETHMSSINALSARLQNALEVFNADSWPVPPVPGRKDGMTVALENGSVLRGALRGWRGWGMCMQRWSGEGGVVDGVVRRVVAEWEGGVRVYGTGFKSERVEKGADGKGEVDGKMEVGEDDGKIGGCGKGKEREVEVDREGVDAAVGGAENLAGGTSPTDTDQHPPNNDTGTTTVLTPQPSASSARIVEVSDDISTGGSEYVSPQEDSPLSFPELRPTMTNDDVFLMLTGGRYLTVDPNEGRPTRRRRSDCGADGSMYDTPAVEDSPEPQYGPKVGDDEDSFSEDFTLSIGGVPYDLPTTETASATDNADATMTAGNTNTTDNADATMTTEESTTTTNNADATMIDANSEQQHGPSVPGISITSPSGDSSPAIQKPTTQLSKSQKKNAARKTAGYKKTTKAKKQKTSHASNEASTSTTNLNGTTYNPLLPFDPHNRATHPPFTPTPSPETMPQTFTHLISTQPTLLAHAILTLTFVTTTPAPTHPSRPHSHLLAHYEVGLDGVESIIQGEVCVPESGGWRTDVREARVGKVGMRKEGPGGMDAGLCARQLAAGHGRGAWLFFAIKWRRTVRDVREGRGGKWVCFGAPVEALKRREGPTEVVDLNLFRDVVEKDEVGERLVEFRRMDVRFSVGGVPCFDLMYGAEDCWNGGVWEKVKGAMASAGCVVSFLYDGQEVGAPKGEKRYWGVLEKEDVGPFFTEGLTEEIPGLLPGFHMQGKRGLGLAEQGTGCVAAPVAEDGKGKGKGKAVTVEDGEEEDVPGGGGEKVEGKAKDVAADPDKKLMPPPRSPLEGKFPQEFNGEWDMAKKALEEGQRKWKAEAEIEALCARMEKANLEAYHKGLKGAGIE